MVRNNRILQAVCLFSALALLVIFCAVSVGAIVPPINEDGDVCYNNGKPTLADASYCAEILEFMFELNFFQTGDFICFGKPTSSTSTRVYTGSTADVAISNGVLTLSRSQGYILTYDFTTQGLSYRGAYAENFTFELADWVCCVLGDGEFVVNSDFSGGSLTNSNIAFLHASWQDYYNKVYYYDENIETAYDNGFGSGYTQGNAQGYENGLDDGYETGYTDGLSTGLAQGLEQGKAAGLIQGRQEGYETGFDDGYETGYDAGYSVGNSEGFGSGLLIGRQEGYETGFDDGYEMGYDYGLDDGYETGYEHGFDDGYETGYDDGIANGESTTTVIEITENIDVGSIISALPEGAKSIIDGALDWDIFGINVAGTLTAILVVAIVGFVVKWLLSLKS